MTLPTFAEFFRALQPGQARYDPFPWQVALAERVVTSDWPEQIGVPTGLGKTTCLDIGVWAMAVGTDVPRRLWYVVNRRLLVDAATERATFLADALAAATDGPIRAVADALRARAALGARGVEGGRPLHVARLRGGVPLDASAPDPSQPTLLLATVPMFASRLLLRGYGDSRGMRPISAAQAGIDATALLDEAHLSRPLRDLMEPLERCDPGDPGTLLPARRARTRLVSLTATGDPSSDTLGLTANDRDHPTVRTRLSARKPTRLVETKQRTLARMLAETALRALGTGGGSTCIVFTNTARTAPEVASAIRKLARKQAMDAEVVLLTGRLRAPDAEAVRARLLGEDGVRSGWVGQRERVLIVVATQTLEVGADLDFEHLVTECAGVRALVQRFGRLNRLGNRNDVASAVVVHAADRKDHPLYGTEVDDVWARLSAAVDASEAGVMDLGHDGIGILGQPGDSPTHVPTLLPHHLWEWSKTGVKQQPPTTVEPFFAGLDDPSPVVSVLWRWWLPPAAEPVVPRPAADEVVELPLWEVRDFLDARTAGRDGTGAWTRIDPEDLTASRAAAPQAIRPGDTILLRCSVGGYATDTGWDPDVTEAVPDLSIVAHAALPVVADASLQGTILRTVGLTDEVAGSLPGVLESLRKVVLSPLEEHDDLPDVADLLTQTMEQLKSVDDQLAAARLREAWDPAPRIEVTGDALVLVPPPGPRIWRTTDVRVDAFDDLSFDATSTALDDHLGAVGHAAEAIARALGLPEDVVSACRTAAALHDVGKADPRFQRRLDPEGTATGLLAKSAPSGTGRRSTSAHGWPSSGRHEELSGRAATEWFDQGRGPTDVDRDLVIHLVVSHHGHGRPLVPPVGHDRLAGPVTLPVDGVPLAVDGDLSTADWDQPRRFRLLCERYGTWGLALLEAVVRQADHAASAAARRGQER